MHAVHALEAAFGCYPTLQAVGIEVVEILIQPDGVVLHAVLPYAVYCFEAVVQVAAADNALLGVAHALPKS